MVVNVRVYVRALKADKSMRCCSDLITHGHKGLLKITLEIITLCLCQKAFPLMVLLDFPPWKLKCLIIKSSSFGMLYVFPFQLRTILLLQVCGRDMFGNCFQNYIKYPFNICPTYLFLYLFNS